MDDRLLVPAMSVISPAAKRITKRPQRSRRGASRTRQSAVRWSAKRFVIIASRFNEPVSRGLVDGATGVLRRAGIPGRNVQLVWVPGAFELPVVAARVARRTPTPHAIIALGALIRGQTPQYEVLAHAVAQGLSQVSVSTGIPVTFGVVVASTAAQANARAGGTLGNRGAEAALAALDVLKLFNDLKPSRGRIRSP